MTYPLLPTPFNGTLKLGSAVSIAGSVLTSSGNWLDNEKAMNGGGNSGNVLDVISCVLQDSGTSKRTEARNSGSCSENGSRMFLSSVERGGKTPTPN